MHSDHREGASSRQAELPSPPAIQPGGLYTRQGLIANLHMTAESFARTLARGERQGKPLRPIAFCTNTHWFSAAKFIEWAESLEPDEEP